MVMKPYMYDSTKKNNNNLFQSKGPTVTSGLEKLEENLDNWF